MQWLPGLLRRHHLSHRCGPGRVRHRRACLPGVQWRLRHGQRLYDLLHGDPAPLSSRDVLRQRHLCGAMSRLPGVQ